MSASRDRFAPDAPDDVESSSPNALGPSTRRVPMVTMVRVGLIPNLVMALLVRVSFEPWVRCLWHVEPGPPVRALVCFVTP